MELYSSNTELSMNDLPVPHAPQIITFLPSFMYVRNRSISFWWSVLDTVFFCVFILTKASMAEKRTDDLANQAIDIIFENNAIQDRLIDPIKRKVIPYLLCFGVFNLILFVLVAFIASRVFTHPSSSSS